MALAILLDQLDKRFRYPEQVTRELGLTILGAIPAIKRVRPGERDAEEAAQVVEAFRTVRMNLAHSYGAAGPVLLTDQQPRRGRRQVARQSPTWRSRSPRRATRRC